VSLDLFFNPFWAPLLPPFYLLYLLYLGTPFRCWDNPSGADAGLGLGMGVKVALPQLNCHISLETEPP
jgi:hypothetical protein